ncbi:hypothetical protein HY605_00725 [Candidatus Peregrinibacteria bacterium]|nr:hypothetical protein [Candidatus Peregrinibacteria bacterium]
MADERGGNHSLEMQVMLLTGELREYGKKLDTFIVEQREINQKLLEFAGRQYEINKTLVELNDSVRKSTEGLQRNFYLMQGRIEKAEETDKKLQQNDEKLTELLARHDADITAVKGRLK